MLYEGGGLPTVCMRVIDTSQTLSLALISCVDLGAVNSYKLNYSHWVEPQTVDFYTADLYLILLSDHNDNFSKYNKKKIVTDYSFNVNGRSGFVKADMFDITQLGFSDTE